MSPANESAKTEGKLEIKDVGMVNGRSWAPNPFVMMIL